VFCQCLVAVLARVPVFQVHTHVERRSACVDFHCRSRPQAHASAAARAAAPATAAASPVTAPRAGRKRALLALAAAAEGADAADAAAGPSGSTAGAAAAAPGTAAAVVSPAHLDGWSKQLTASDCEPVPAGQPRELSCAFPVPCFRSFPPGKPLQAAPILHSNRSLTLRTVPWPCAVPSSLAGKLYLMVTADLAAGAFAAIPEGPLQLHVHGHAAPFRATRKVGVAITASITLVCIYCCSGMSRKGRCT
jgi:hypothetical protein